MFTYTLEANLSIAIGVAIAIAVLFFVIFVASMQDVVAPLLIGFMMGLFAFGVG